MYKKLAGLLLSLFLGFSTANAQEVTLKFAHFWPTAAGPHADFALDWTKKISECSNGDIKFEFHTAGTQLGNTAKLEDYLRAGLVDIAHGLNHFPRGRFTPATISDTPMLAKSAYANSNTLWTLFEEGIIAKPYKGLKVLALHAHNAGLIHTNGKGNAVHVPADLKGKRIRAPSPAVSMMLEELGAVPVGMPPPDTYEALSKGTVEGTIFPFEGVSGFKLAEVLDYASNLKLNAASFWFAMNEKKYNSLSEANRKCIDDNSYRPLVNEFGVYWDKWDQPGIDQTLAAGNEIIEPNAEEKILWAEAMKPIIVKYLESLKKDGFTNADEAYERAKFLIGEYEAKYQQSKK